MSTKGYTKIPNAIIRSGIPAGEVVVWCFIASMPPGYAYTVEQASAELGINIKTWHSCVKGLLRRRMITVEHVPGKANIYEVVRDTEIWENTPPKKRYPQKTVPLPKNGTTPHPKNGMGTHSYNIRLINNTLVDARARMREEVMSDMMVEIGCRSIGISVEQYRSIADEIFNDWTFQDLADNEWTKQHFLAVMRIKAKILNNNGTSTDKNRRTIAEGRAERAAGIARQMAALAAQSGTSEKLPY